MATDSSIPGEFHRQRSLPATVHGVSRVGNDLATKPPPMVSSIPSTCLQYLSEVSLLPFAPFQIGLLSLLKSELSLYIQTHTIFKCVIFRYYL